MWSWFDFSGLSNDLSVISLHVFLRIFPISSVQTSVERPWGRRESVWGVLMKEYPRHPAPGKKKQIAQRKVEENLADNTPT